MSEIPHSRPWITPEDASAVHAVLSAEMIARGKEVNRFEEEIAARIGSAGAIAFSSGTAALTFGLRSLVSGPDSEVILPDYVCPSVLKAVRLSGARPVLCDIGSGTWNMTPETVAPHINRRTAAVVTVHVFGIPADVQGLLELGIPIIEDAAQAFGASCENQAAGSVGDMGMFSFHATKCLTCGEGGMLVVRDAERLERLTPADGETGEAAWPLSDLQAALGRSQLSRYDSFLDRRAELATLYLETLPASLSERLYAQPPGGIFFRFPLYGPFDFADFQAELVARGVQIRRGVDMLLHRSLGRSDRLFPNAVKAFQHTLCLPIYPALSKEDALGISELFTRAWKGNTQ